VAPKSATAGCRPLAGWGDEWAQRTRSHQPSLLTRSDKKRTALIEQQRKATADQSTTISQTVLTAAAEDGDRAATTCRRF